MVDINELFKDFEYFHFSLIRIGSLIDVCTFVICIYDYAYIYAELVYIQEYKNTRYTMYYIL